MRKCEPATENRRTPYRRENRLQSRRNRSATTVVGAIDRGAKRRIFALVNGYRVIGQTRPSFWNLAQKWICSR